MLMKKIFALCLHETTVNSLLLFIWFVGYTYHILAEVKFSSTSQKNNGKKALPQRKFVYNSAEHKQGS